MKKSSRWGGICILLMALGCFLLVSCNNTAPSNGGTSSHSHEWGEWSVVKNPTCISEGQSERVCACGEKESQNIQRVSHNSTGWVITKKATLKASGIKQQICFECKAVFQEKEIPPVTVNSLPGITDVEQDLYRPSYNMANCRQLKGNPVVVLIFMDDNESHWTEDEVLTFTREQVLVGLEYLEKNAKKWGVNLDFVVECYSTPLSDFKLKYEGTVNRNLYIGGSTKDVLDKAAADIGCNSNWKLYSYYKAMYPKEEIIFLNVLNKSGKSYARNAISAGYSEYSEHCVIFADYLGSSPSMRKDGSRASTVAHELLHLFGAEDYYMPSAREALADQIYPNDIMLWQYDKIEDNKIGDCTAFSVGWTDMVPEVCFDERWWD